MTNSSSSRLFTPLQLNSSVTLSHRLVMAPLTRFRASDSNVPLLPMVSTYYSQRAIVPGTLIITEATFISPRAAGYPNVPGIWNQAQIDAWKKVTDAVHEKGSFIFCQLWALGRVANAEVLKKMEGGPYDVVSSSAIPFQSNPRAPNDTPPPRELSVDEIKGFVEDYAQAAKNAIAAGFDGVEIHGANGYLVDQFIQDNVNQRTDAYGGSIENRCRFGLEVAKAVVEAVGADKTAIRLSPFSEFQGMKMKDPVPQFTKLLEGLRELKLVYVHVVESRIAGNADVEATEKVDFAVDTWNGTSPVFFAGGFRPDSARRAVDEEYKNRDIAIVFGRYFISNPDLVWKVKNNVELTKYNRDKFYNAKSEDGYTTWTYDASFEEGARL